MNMSVLQISKIMSDEFHPKTLNMAQFILLQNKHSLFMLYLINSVRMILAVIRTKEHFAIKTTSN